jgi:hypothetical protein
MPGIHSERAILIEGNADEIVPNAKLAADMHGFVIMVPPGEGSEWFLDMLWRITMLYAGRPNWLKSRSRVAKMVEAVMSKKSREPSPALRPARRSELADLTPRDRIAVVEALIRPPAPNARLRSAVAKSESLLAPRDGDKPKTRKKS